MTCAKRIGTIAPMTIRDHVKRKYRWALVAVCVVAAIAALHPGMLWVAVAFVLANGVAILALWCTKCPRCATNLGSTALLIGKPPRAGPVLQCPHCGVSLDEPMVRESA